MTDRIQRVLRDVEALEGAARALLAEHRQVCAGAEAAIEPLRLGAARLWLASVPVARLKDVADGPFRLAPVEGAEFVSVADILGLAPAQLQTRHGIGPVTARRLHTAAAGLAEAAARSASLRIGIGRRDEVTETLVAALHRLVNAGPDALRDRALAERVLEIVAQERWGAYSAVWWRRTFPPWRRRSWGREELAKLRGLLDGPAAELLRAPGLVGRPVPAGDAWRDFRRRPADYHAVLADLAGLTSAGEAAEGLLPAGPAEEVRRQPLDRTHLTVRLRDYQAFGARFAITRRRVILGDEPGLGKRVQAIAAIAHRRAEGATHFLVACPASMLLTWVRDIEAHSSLAAHPLRAPGRPAAVERWTAAGGVAVAPLDALPHLSVSPEMLGMFVVDGAYNTRKRETRHARAVTDLCQATGNVMLLTGIPLENRIKGLRSLLAHLPAEATGGTRPEEAVLGTRAFRAAMSPVHLRRDQRDVLAELPDVVRTDELVALSRADAALYRDAEGDIAAMRRAAFALPRRSAKLRRLRELVRGAAANDQKVAVFSCDRDVLADVGRALGGGALGPVTTGTAAALRRDLADAFSAGPGHAVLLAEIGAEAVARGAGVVVLCEPQDDPGLEARAIGRVLGSGRPGVVRVHRLLAPGTVDEWIGVTDTR